MRIRSTILSLALLASAVRAETPWAERETRLANEYLSLLVERPEYGRVVDLLWDLYKKHDATKLLLENIDTQAKSSKHPSPWLIEGHLLRKSGELTKAAACYDEALKIKPNDLLARRARAELANEQGLTDLAVELQTKIADSLPDTDSTKADVLMQLGNLALGAKKTEEAAEAWQKATKLKPNDLTLARTVAELMLRAGYPERAVALLETLAKQSDPQKRLDAFSDLARIHEHADQLPKADKALRDALSLLDFRDGRYASFFLRRVRLHERFGLLDDLRAQLAASVKTQRTEQALSDMARFSALTADADEQMIWLRELVKAAPSSDQHRWELVRALLDHEGAAEAATILDERLKNDGSDLPALVLLRAEADLRQGKAAEVQPRLTALLKAQPSIEVEKQVLAFAQERTLDDLIETILKRRVDRTQDKPEPVFELATFYRSHDRAGDAMTLLHAYADRGATAAEQARRLNDAAAFLAAGGDEEEAMKLQTAAAKLSNGGREELVRLADLMAGSGQNTEAVTQLEAAYSKATTVEERMDIDDRLYSVLLGDQKDKAPKKAAATTSTEFTLPAFMRGDSFGSDEPVEDKSSVKLPTSVVDYAKKIIAAADGGDANLLRAIWWASRTGRRNELYRCIRRLTIDPKTHQRPELPLEVERLLLEVAMADENPMFAGHQLHRLIDIDPANRVQFMLRLAEQQMAISLPESAVAVLERAVKEQPENESVLSALTQCYKVTKQPEKALELWRAAIQRTSGNASTPLRERYANLLLQANKLGDYVETQISIVESETDIKRRRDIFKRFLDQVLWSESLGGEVAQSVVNERLKLVEGRLIERTRKHPFDGFYHEALAAVYEKRGEEDKAFASMKQAYYTSPDTPFSLDQLRAAALRANDTKTAIYFQKQIAATAAPKDLASESRQLIQLLEQTFQIAEADKVRRRLENRLSQDPQALEDLARYYQETGQDEAERRVYEQIQRVMSWDARSTLRLALKCVAVADEAAAEKQLRQLLAKTQARNSLKALPPDRWPYPISDERRAGTAVSLKDLVELLESSHGLQKAEADRLRTWLSFPRPEFAELPDDVSLVRLRGIEELAKLVKRSGGKALEQWTKEWVEDAKPMMIERLWALFYAGANEEFRGLLTESIGNSETLELQFVHAWMMVRARGMKDALTWMQEPRAGTEKMAQRKRLLRAVTGMLAEWDRFEYSPQDLNTLGNARLMSMTAIFDVVRRLQDRQRYTEAMALVESLRRQSPDQWRSLSFVLASFAQAAEIWDKQRQYLHEALADSPQAGGYEGEAQDSFISGVTALYRLARTPQERDEVIKAAMARVRQSPRSTLTTMREAAVSALAGASDPAANALSDLASGSFLSNRQLAAPRGGLMPQGSIRGEESNHLRGYWEELRMIGAVFSQQGLSKLVGAMDDVLHEELGAVQLGPRTSDTFSLWRTTRLIRELYGKNYPTRVRLVREFLASTDMKEEDSVEVLQDLGRELEVNGLIRECVEVYRQLPSRAPGNTLYADYYMRVCEQSMEPHEARLYVEHLFRQDPLHKPQAIGDEVLREKHARFLFLERDEKRLKELSWKQGGGYTQVMQGRIAYEVPYARELANLREHDGDTKGALEAWNQMHNALAKGTEDHPFPPDAECELHRARLMMEMKAPEVALEALREVQITDALDDTKLEVLKLRAQLAAQTTQWDDVRQLMTIAVEKRSPALVLAITEQCRLANRQTEALNYLTQAERAMKGADERFALRLEQLRFQSLDANWTPERGRAQISALFRSGARHLETMNRLVQWLLEPRQQQNAKSWMTVLRAEARSGSDPGIAALGLCAFAKQWPDNVLPKEITASWGRANEKDRACIEIAARVLLEQDQPVPAWAACSALRLTPSGVQSRLIPIAAKVAGALKDEMKLRELYAEIVRMPFPGGTQTKDWAQAFEQTGHADWTRELYDLAEQQLASTGKPNGELTLAHIQFLIAQHHFEAAEDLLLKHYQSFIPQSAGVIVQLYREWQKLERIEAEIGRYFLPDGVRNEVLFLAGKR